MATSKKVFLTMQQQLDIIKDLETLPVTTVAKKCNMDTRTIRRIRNKAPIIWQFAKRYGIQKKRLIMVKPRYAELDVRLFSWYTEKRALGNYISEAQLFDKAAELREDIPSCSDFKISNGWLGKFKKRHNIRLNHSYNDETSVDEDAAKKFVDDFQIIMEEENIRPENVYNMNESSLLWRNLPKNALVGLSERHVIDFKIYKAQIRIVLCANATGTNKITPLVISKYKHPRALKNWLDNTSIIFKTQRYGFMDKAIFSDWYENCFKPKVRTYQLENQIYGKVILLLSNCHEHKSVLQTDNNFRILYFPPNTASLIQPMSQGVIDKTKKLFYRNMMLSILCTRGIKEFYKNYYLKACLIFLRAAWEEVTANDVKNAWKKVVPCGPIEESDETQLDTELQGIVSQITGKMCTPEQLREFLSQYASREKCPVRQNEEKGEKKDNQEEKEETQDRKEGTQELKEKKQVMELSLCNKKNEENEEISRNELIHIFEKLEHHSRKKPKMYNQLIQILKTDFLEDDE